MMSGLAQSYKGYEDLAKAKVEDEVMKVFRVKVE